MSTKALNKEYKEYHVKSVKKLRNVNSNDNLVLPKIKNRYKTHENKKDKKDDDEK